ncbi:hypothetical protein SBADM41S_08024 [Streptomyces badius]
MSIGNSPEDDRPSIGRALQQARIAAGLTAEEVSSSTRVRIPIVHAIEQDDFSRCGGDVYARGHIRTLARAVGLDPAPLVEEYDADHGGRPAPTPAAPLFEAERIRSEPRRPNWTAAMVAAIVAVVGFVGFTLFSGEDEPTNTAQVAEGSKPDKTAAKPTATEPADPEPVPSESAIAAAPRDKVTVKLSADRGKSWISVKDHNGRRLFDRGAAARARLRPAAVPQRRLRSGLALLRLGGLRPSSMITGLFDGHLARTYNLVTDFGKIADPIADKAIMGAALVSLSILGDLPWWMPSRCDHRA